MGEATLPDRRSTGFQFGNVQFSLVTRQGLKDSVVAWLDGGSHSMMVTLTGAHGVHESKRNQAVRRAHAEADIVLCDGTPPFIAAILSGYRRKVDRIPGREATRIIADVAARRGTFQFFLGGPPGLAAKAKQGLEDSLGMSITGECWSPPFSAVVDEEFVREVTDRLQGMPRPAVLWIGLSTPKQELVAREIKRRFPSGFLIACVGAAFDMYAGTRKPAPIIVSRVGLEWLYRSFQEPKRLPARYARTVPTVVSALALAALSRIGSFASDRAGRSA